MSDLIDIVDMNGNPTGEKVKNDIAHANGILHRVVHLHMYDSNGYILFQKRSARKKHFPGMLHFAVGGHINAGESVLDGLYRECKEELGIQIEASALQLISLYHHTSAFPEYDLVDNEIAFDYMYLYDGNVGNFIFEDDEVESIKKIHLSELFELSGDEYKSLNIVPYEFYPDIFQSIRNSLNNSF